MQMSHRKENINHTGGGPHFFMVQPHPSLFPSSCFHSQSENVTESSRVETHMAEGHGTARVKWVTFSLLIHLMSNSDELCSSLRLTTEKKMFSCWIDLGTQKIKTCIQTFSKIPLLFFFFLPSPTDDKLVFGLGHICCSGGAPRPY